MITTSIVPNANPLVITPSVTRDFHARREFSSGAAKQPPRKARLRVGQRQSVTRENEPAHRDPVSRMRTPPSNVLPTRREFLRNTALMGGAAILAPRLFGETPAPSGPRIRLGVAGGNFGASFFWNEHPNCIVAAVTDLLPERRERLMKVYGCSQSYPSLEEMVKDKSLDAIAVFTDGTLHYQHAVLCLRHGKHVISAVPAVLAATPELALEQAQGLLDAVKRSGLTYMMAETSVWRQRTITARRLFQAGELGEIISCDADYFHPGLRVIYGTAEKPKWRYGLPPMFYPTHCTSFLTSTTGERLLEVACDGWGDDDPVCRKNAFANNPYWNETAHFRTSRNTAFRVRVWWEAPVWEIESCTWFGTKMTITERDIVWKPTVRQGRDDAGFVHQEAEPSPLEKKEWWKTDLLPEPMRHASGHGGSHTFIAHEFIDALVHNRKPLVDIHEALAYTVPGIIAHQSALKAGEQLKIPQFD